MSNREENLKTSYNAYSYALDVAAASGKLNDLQRAILGKLGDVVRALVEEHCPNVSPGENMALLTLAQKFGITLIGAIDSSAEKQTPYGIQYRNAVLPVMLEMLRKGVITPDMLPKGVAPVGEEVAEQAAEAV